MNEPLMAAQLVLTPLPMSDSPRFDVSVILPFGDDEEFVGIAVKRTAEHLRGLGLSFEILAIDEDSGDNSHAVLALLRVLEVGSGPVAVERNAEIVPRAEHGTTVLGDGDRVEVVQFVGGG